MSSLLRIPADKMSVVPLGVNMDGHTRRTSDNRSEFRIGYFARIAPEKGLHVLADAYIQFRNKTAPHRALLEVAGYTSPDHTSYMDNIRRKLDKAKLSAEFDYRGVVDREGKLQFLRELDVLSVPATYDEPKGMFLLEAMASGVPVVQPRRGAFVEIVNRTGGGILVEPDSPGSLSEGLHSLWNDRAMLATLSDRAFTNVREHYSVGRSTEKLLEVYEQTAKRN
jgi:glycosyltransferase involved in cell wall biosynthesis